MSNIPRFVKEYANYKKREIVSNSLMGAQFKEQGISKVNTSVRCLEKGYMTIDESIQMILEALSD